MLSICRLPPNNPPAPTDRLSLVRLNVPVLNWSAPLLTSDPVENVPPSIVSVLAGSIVVVPPTPSDFCAGTVKFAPNKPPAPTRKSVLIFSAPAIQLKLPPLTTRSPMLSVPPFKLTTPVDQIVRSLATVTIPFGSTWSVPAPPLPTSSPPTNRRSVLVQVALPPATVTSPVLPPLRAIEPTTLVNVAADTIDSEPTVVSEIVASLANVAAAPLVNCNVAALSSRRSFAFNIEPLI